MNATAVILQELDDRAEAFEFPVLDNANAQFIAARLRGFRNGDDWGLVFEVLVFAPLERAIVTDVYAYGPLVGDDRWSLTQCGGLDEIPESPLWSDSGHWISGRALRHVLVAGKRIEISCDPAAESGVQLTPLDCESEVRFTRALVKMLGLEQFVPVNTLIDQMPGLGLAQQLFALTNWDHPDIAGGEIPHQSTALRAAANFLAGEVNSLDFDPSNGNLDDPKWDQSDC